MILSGLLIDDSALIQLLKFTKMKTLLSFVMPVLIFITSVVSCKLFSKSDYYVSAILTITSYLSVILWVEILSHKKLILS